MHLFEWMYLIFGGYLVLAGLSMVIAYSLTNPWWRTQLGRMMVTYAMAEVLMSTLLTSTVVWHFNPIWFRTVWFFLIGIVGLTLTYQTYTIVKLNRQRRTRERTQE